VRAVAVANERRAQRRLERYRIKQQTKVALAEASGRARSNEAGHKREMTKVLERHDRTDARWLDYEIDIAKLLDFPLMTDMRDPLTIAFHKAKSHADWLRPDSVDDILGDRNAQLEYRDAVGEYVAAFDVAESEAIRRRRSDFSAEAQERLARAQNLLRLASDGGATPQERQSAYAGAEGTRRAHRVACDDTGQHRTQDRGRDRGLTGARECRLLRLTRDRAAAHVVLSRLKSKF
jgi:hypothetical protein